MYGIIVLLPCMKSKMEDGKNTLPVMFKSILWSYNLSDMDLERHRKTIIVNTLHYGDLKHLRWLVRYYGKDTIRTVLSRVPETELKPRARRLASILFSIKKFTYARRSTHH